MVVPSLSFFTYIVIIAHYSFTSDKKPLSQSLFPPLVCFCSLLSSLCFQTCFYSRVITAALPLSSVILSALTLTFRWAPPCFTCDFAGMWRLPLKNTLACNAVMMMTNELAPWLLCCLPVENIEHCIWMILLLGVPCVAVHRLVL